MKATGNLTITLLCSATLCASVTGCTRPRQTTAVGTAAGTVIGAGLGAIIGNQTGNAGSGVAIGAAAGAATGALVGNALQANQEAAQANNEAISRQEKTIRAQQSEISELRRMQSDTGTGAGASTVNAYLVEQKRLQLQRRGPSPRGGEVKTVRYTPPPVYRSEPLARYDMRKSPVATKPAPLPKRDLAPAPVPVVMQSETLPPVNANLEEKDLAQELKTTAPAKKVAEKAPVVEPVIEESVAKNQPSPESPASCEESKEERESASNASEGSDKLFHLRRALRLCPQSAETHYELGKVYLSMDRAVDASYEFKQALASDPSYGPAKESLQELEQTKVKF